MHEDFHFRSGAGHSGARHAVAVVAVTIAAIFFAIAGTFAGEADVMDAQADRAADGTWRFDVTVRHADDGWDHYADAWDVRGEDGTVYGTRELLHPHDDEQPFTRSLTGVSVPQNVERVIVRAHDSVHGHGGEEVTVELAR